MLRSITLAFLAVLVLTTGLGAQDGKKPLYKGELSIAPPPIAGDKSVKYARGRKGLVRAGLRHLRGVWCRRESGRAVPLGKGCPMHGAGRVLRLGDLRPRLVGVWSWHVSPR